jgi:hypothetical protein
MAADRPGPYQIQAAIAAVHAAAPDYKATDWRQIRVLYDRLHLFTPSPIVRLNRAVATRFAIGSQAALAEVDQLAGDLDGYRLFHAVRAELLNDLGRHKQARRAPAPSRWLPTRPNASYHPPPTDVTSRPHCAMTGLISITIHPESTPGQVFASSTASSMVAVSSSE